MRISRLITLTALLSSIATSVIALASPQHRITIQSEPECRLLVQVSNQTTPPAIEVRKILAPENFESLFRPLKTPHTAVSNEWVHEILNQYLKYSLSQGPKASAYLVTLESLLRQAMIQQKLETSRLYLLATDHPLEKLVGTQGQRFFYFLHQYVQENNTSVLIVFSKLKKEAKLNKNSDHYWMLRYLLIEMTAHTDAWSSEISDTLHNDSILHRMDESMFDMAMGSPLMLLNFTSEVLENYTLGGEMARRVTAFSASDLARRWAFKQKKPAAALFELFKALSDAVLFRLENYTMNPVVGRSGWFFSVGHENGSTVGIAPDGRFWRADSFKPEWALAETDSFKSDFRPLSIIPIQPAFSQLPAYGSTKTPPGGERDLKNVPFLKMPTALPAH